MTSRTEAEVQTWLQTRLARSIDRPPEAIGMHTPFADMGIESLEGVNVAVDLEQWLGRNLPSTLLWEYPHIASLSAYLAVHTDAASSESGTGPIPEEHYVFEKVPAFVEFETRRAALLSSGLENPYFREIRGTGSPVVEIGGRQVVSFCSYNYLGNAYDDAVLNSFIETARQEGASVSSSRLVGGERAIHGQLERAMAEFLGVEAALLYVSGHSTNVATVGTLMGPRDLILYDQLAHDSLLRGARLSHARMQPFPHNNWKEVDRVLTAQRRQFEKVLILVDGLYSAEGDVCILPEFVKVKRRHHAWLFLDEAHALGVLGENGKGTCEYWNVPVTEIDVWMSTLSKALGSMGGIVAGKRVLVDFLRYNSSGFVLSVGMPAPLAAAALAALTNLRNEPARRKRLAQLCRRFDDRARTAGLDLGGSIAQSPTKPVIVGDAIRCIAVSNRLLERGIAVQPLVPPSTPVGQSRLRFFVTCLHSEAQIDQAVAFTAEELHCDQAAHR